jgi:hypothetical protein
MADDSLVYEAMKFTRQVHDGQTRKYTNEPYSGHLAEVAGIVSAMTDNPEAIATAWLHDTVEDQNIDLRVSSPSASARRSRKGSRHFPTSKPAIARSAKPHHAGACGPLRPGYRRSRSPISSATAAPSRSMIRTMPQNISPKSAPCWQCSIMPARG